MLIKIKIILIVSLMTLLSSSSFFLPLYLQKKLLSLHYNRAQLAYALSLSMPTAYLVKRQQYPKNSRLWLHYSIELARNQGNAAFQLANYYLHQEQLLQQSNDSINSKILMKKIIFWYQQAIDLGYEPASLALAKWYSSNQQWSLAQQSLSKMSTTSLMSKILKIKMDVAQGNEIDKKLHVKVTKLYSEKNSQWLGLLEKLRKYQIINNGTLARLNASTPYCHNSIQFFATNLRDLVKVEQLIKAFKTHPLNKFVCFLPVRYQSLKKLQCTSQLTKTITCDETLWTTVAKSVKARFVALMVPSGIANVHLGILYIDEHDTSEVFAHEISHLLGFVDEYPLPKNHVKCQRVQTEKFSVNIAVLPTFYYGHKNKVRKLILSEIAWADKIKISTPIIQKTSKKHKIDQWIIGTPLEYKNSVGIFAAKSCDKTKFQAYKPVAYLTQLNYYEKQFPSVYADIFSHTNGRYLMPSFQYNIALAYIKKGRMKLASPWIAKSAQFETIAVRKNKINTVSF